MSRPRYESDGDRANQQAFADRVNREARGFRLVRNEADGTGEGYSADYLVVAGSPDAVVGQMEYKRRDMVFGQYPSVVLTAEKLKALMLASHRGLRGWFVVEDNAGRLYAHEARLEHWEDGDLQYTAEGGRTTKTRDAKDVEPSFYIPNRLFVPFETLEIRRP